MKYQIKKLNDKINLTQEGALELAKKQLKETNYDAAVYGKNVNGKMEYFQPILMNEDALEEYRKKPSNTNIYVLYRRHIEDAPLYEIEYQKGDAFINIPTEEIEEVIKVELQKMIENPRLLARHLRDLEDMLQKELQEYADEQFYKKGRGTIHEEDSIKDEEKSKMSFEDLFDVYNALFNQVEKFFGKDKIVVTLTNDDTGKDYEYFLYLDYADEDGVSFYINGSDGVYHRKYFGWYAYEVRGFALLKLSHLIPNSDTLSKEELLNIINNLTKQKIFDGIYEATIEAEVSGNIDVEEYKDGPERDH